MIHVVLHTGVEDAAFPDQDKISLINPAQGKLLVLNRYDQPANPDIAIYDLNGKVIFSTSLIDLSKGITEVNVDMNSFKEGIYLYRIRLEEDHMFGKLVKIKN